jgi:D-glycero-D-manno-heptose 1,7-bisphosphate phosphatase
MGAVERGRRRAVFLDRDGVINRNVLNPATGELESPLAACDFEFIPGALHAMRELSSAGFLLFLVSNQPNFAKGKSTLEQLASIHDKFLAGITLAGIEFAQFYYCLHHPDGIVSGYSCDCECRKPSPYFLLKADSQFNLDLSGSWMIGDRPTDVACGRAAGAGTIFIHPSVGNSGGEPDSGKVARDLSAAARLILSRE